MPPRQIDATAFNPDGLPMRLAATYGRDIAASPARIWENVRDWEHLPWLHAGSFAECRLEDEGDWGWRARTRGREAEARETVVEVALDLPNRRYVSRTLDGPLPGVEIWTRLSPIAPRRTRVDVEFHLPHLSEAQAEKAGRALVALYTTLWDEDEAMMIARQQALDAPRANLDGKSVSLGSVDTLRASLPRLVEAGGVSVRIVEREGRLVAYRARCPHLMAPLGGIEPDAEGILTCPWHGYRFDIETGCSTDGRGLSLGRSPRIEIAADGEAVLVWT